MLKLIPEWRKAPRMLSMQAMSAATALLGAWQAVPEELREHVPTTVLVWLVLALLVLGMVGRLLWQPGVRDEGPQP